MTSAQSTDETAAVARLFDISPTLAINQYVLAERARGRDVIHLGFGEARLPAPPSVTTALRDAAEENRYGAVDGERCVRESIAAWMTRRGLPTDPDQVILTPGSKAGLFALLLALNGDLVLPRPSWVSYAAQGRLVGKRVIWCDVPPLAGGLPDPGELVNVLDKASRNGAKPGVLILTVPDNPTGTHPDTELLGSVLRIADEWSLAVIADEIYRDLAFTDDALPFAANLAPERTFVTTGLSKSLALGGWRVGVVRVPANNRGVSTMAQLRATASEIWSCISAPIARAVQIAFDEPDDIRRYLERARAVHRTLVTNVYECVVRLGYSCRPPQAGFYLYPSLAGRVTARDDRDLQQRLLAEAGIATLPGSAFGDHAERLRLRMATSPLCGETLEEQWETLEAGADLLSLPRIARRLDEIEDRLRRLDCSQHGC